jgi:hypothetical protein
MIDSDFIYVLDSSYFLSCQQFLAPATLDPLLQYSLHGRAMDNTCQLDNDYSCPLAESQPLWSGVRTSCVAQTVVDIDGS